MAKKQHIHEAFPDDSRLTVTSAGDCRSSSTFREPEVWIGNGNHGVGPSLAGMRRYAMWLLEMADKSERVRIAEADAAKLETVPNA